MTKSSSEGAPGEPLSEVAVPEALPLLPDSLPSPSLLQPAARASGTRSDGRRRPRPIDMKGNLARIGCKAARTGEIFLCLLLAFTGAVAEKSRREADLARARRPPRGL